MLKQQNDAPAPAPRRNGGFAPTSPLVRARAALLSVFFVNGATLGIWVPHIPIIQARLGIGPGMLGLALLGIGAGSLIGMPTAGALVGRYGSRRVTTVAAILFPMLVLIPIRAPVFAALAGGLFLFGLGNGLLDVGMNTHAVGVEHRYARSIMTSFHAAWSLGGLLGAIATGIALERIAVDELRIALLITPLLAAALWGATGLLRDLTDSGRTTPTITRPRKALLGLGVVAFLALVGEGAMADWSTVYLYAELGAGSSMAAAGYAAFTLSMATGRLLGDTAIRRAGRRGVLRWSGLAGATGMGLALAIPHPPVVLIGFALVGIGAANIVPILFASAGQLAPDSPGRAIAAVAGLGYIGLLSGPVLIGSTAEFVNLPAGLALVAAAYFGVAFTSRAVRA